LAAGRRPTSAADSVPVIVPDTGQAGFWAAAQQHHHATVNAARTKVDMGLHDGAGHILKR